MNIEAVSQISNYIQLKPLIEAMQVANDQSPHNALPIDTQGTIQENAKSIPEVTLYNAHGILTKTKPNTLIGLA